MYRSVMTSNNTQVFFPEFKAERIYMQKFHKEEGLPEYLRRWQDTVDAMLVDVDTDNPIFIMIDQGIVKAGHPHRRPGRHIDGYWIEGISAHRSDGGGSHQTRVPDHHTHRQTHIFREPSPGGHENRPRHAIGSGDSELFLNHPEAIILASDVSGCIGYTGSWTGEIGDGGNLEHLDLSHMEKHVLQPNHSYIGNVGFIHESVPINFDCQRTLVRLNVKNWEPKFH